MADTDEIINDLRRQLAETRETNAELMRRLVAVRSYLFSERLRAENGERLYAVYHALAVEAIGEEEVRRRRDLALKSWETIGAVHEADRPPGEGGARDGG